MRYALILYKICEYLYVTTNLYMDIWFVDTLSRLSVHVVIYRSYFKFWSWLMCFPYWTSVNDVSKLLMSFLFLELLFFILFFDENIKTKNVRCLSTVFFYHFYPYTARHRLIFSGGSFENSMIQFELKNGRKTSVVVALLVFKL